MQISEQSWHYQLIETMNGYPSENLCTYFWQVAGRVLAILLVLFGAGVILFALAQSLVLLLALFEFITLSDNAENNALVMTLFIFAALCIASIHSVFGLIGDSIKKPRKPTLIGQYLRAKKERICPVIEFTSK